MDSHYFLALLSLLIGMLAGFQGIHDRCHTEYKRALKTVWAWLYLFSRGAVPAAIFCILHTRRDIESWAWLYAIGSATATELVLRSKFYIKQEVGQNGQTGEMLKGGLDLVRWYQSFFLDNIAPHIAASRRDFVKGTLPEGKTLVQMYEIISRNRNAWDEPGKVKIEQSLNRNKQQYQKALRGNNQGDPAKIDEIYRYELAYSLILAVGREGFITLMKE